MDLIIYSDVQICFTIGVLKMILNKIILKISSKLEKYKVKQKWRKMNPSNFTYLSGFYDNWETTKIGKGSYGSINVMNDRKNNKLVIGNYCSIAGNVVFLVGLDHATNRVSTYPFKQMYKLAAEDYRDAISKGDIIVDDDVWIGYNATILSGVHIGQGEIVAAGAVVSKDVPPYAIVGGVPAKVIKYRFDDDMIKELLKIDYSKLTLDMIKEHLDDLYKPLKNKKQLDWMPKK